MYSHLVAVEVRVESGTAKRMEFNGSALDQNGFKCLNTESVQGRRTVQHNGMVFNDHFQCIPNLGLGAFHHFSCGFDIARNACFDQTFHNKGLEQLQCHLFRQTALVNFEFGTDNDNRTARIVYTFTEQILTETSLLTFQHVGKRLQRTVVRTCYGSAASAVVNQRVHSLLQHSFLIADDDFGCAQLQQSLQTVVAVDDASVQIVQVRCCETAAVQLHHRANVGRNDGQNIHNHPLGAVARLLKCLGNLQAL